MAKNKIKGNYSINTGGGVVCELHSDDKQDKRFAVVVKCGHCGKGYFIPIIFTATCKDLEAAKEIAKNTPRVKNAGKGTVIDAFEISEIEFRFINEVNYRHDSYLNSKFNGLFNDTNRQVIGRRIAMDLSDDLTGGVHRDYRRIRTREDYNQIWNKFERHFAPVNVNGKLVYPDPRREQYMHDFYKSATMRFGLNKDDVYLMLLYYRMYGDNNELNISLEDEYIRYIDMRKDGGRKISMVIPENLERMIEEKLGNEYGIKSYNPNRKRNVESDIMAYIDDEQTFKTTTRPSQIDKFKARMAKTDKKVSGHAEEPENY